ncbi:hypothetical protein CANCADRAFT_55404 [Tortispora caseinolytica NRRL Y-17796]|uniref:Anaphase-promoting complex subunit 2 n=1 Tax=Tortispora caseinolytica NRRL Y-17796 TaxID=767744 RepID=A0A1E4TIH7_9ASCO|nr:hypothetical protein CANCADRAFT_55404 [Tortispora caseinolytica NRRL Y-17796]
MNKQTRLKQVFKANKHLNLIDSKAWNIVWDYLNLDQYPLPPSKEIKIAFASLDPSSVFSAYSSAVHSHFLKNASPLLTHQSCDNDVCNLANTVNVVKVHYVQRWIALNGPPAHNQKLLDACSALIEVSLPSEIEQMTTDLYIHAIEARNPERARTVYSVFRECGLHTFSDSCLTSAVKHTVTSHVTNSYRKTWDSSAYDDLMYWIFNVVVSSLSYITDLKESELNAVNDLACDALAALRIEEIYDIVCKMPQSEPALNDLSATLRTPKLRLDLVNTFLSQSSISLLRAGIPTLEIICRYIATMEAFRRIEPRGVLLDRVARPIRNYLRERSDTVSLIVAGMLNREDSPISYISESIKKKQAYRDTGDDYNDPAWVPDPVDAAPDFSSSQMDIVGSLLNIFESNDVFIREISNCLASDLLKVREYDVNTLESQLKALRNRFSEAAMQSCNIMIWDVQESAATDAHIHQSSDDLSVFHSHIISRYFWPSLKEEPYRLPQFIEALQEQYGVRYSEYKPLRKLKWYGVGSVAISLELQDRTCAFNVTPLQASFILLFEDTAEGMTLDTISQKLGCTKRVAEGAASFWVKEGILTQNGTIYTVVETTQDDSDAVMEEDVEVEPKDEAQELRDSLGAFKPFISAMLTNLGRLPADRIHAFLSSLSSDENPYRSSKQELIKYLDMLVEEDFLEFDKGYKVRK